MYNCIFDLISKQAVKIISALGTFLLIAPNAAIAGELLKYETTLTNESLVVSYDNEHPCVLRVEKYDSTSPTNLTATLTTFLPFYEIVPQDQQNHALIFTQNFLHLALRNKEKAERDGQEVSQKFGDYLRFATEQSGAFTQDYSNFHLVYADLDTQGVTSEPTKHSQSVFKKLGELIKDGTFGTFMQRNHVEVYQHEGSPTYVVGPLLDWVLPTPDQEAKKVKARLVQHMDMHCTIEKVLETW